MGEQSFWPIRHIERGSRADGTIAKCRDCQRQEIFLREPDRDGYRYAVVWHTINGYLYCPDCYRKLPEHVR